MRLVLKGSPNGTECDTDSTEKGSRETLLLPSPSFFCVSTHLAIFCSVSVLSVERGVDVMLALLCVLAVVAVAAGKEQLRIGVLHKPEACERKSKTGDKV